MPLRRDSLQIITYILAASFALLLAACGPASEEPSAGSGGTVTAGGMGGAIAGNGGAVLGGTGGNAGSTFAGAGSGAPGTAGTATGGIDSAGQGGRDSAGSAGTGRAGTPTGGSAGIGRGGAPAGGSAGIARGGAPAGSAGTASGGTPGGAGGGSCCSDGDCICRGDAPTSLTSENGPHATKNYSLSGVGCIYYPTDAQPPFSAVAISDGYLGSGGCGTAQTSGWGPFYASHGIVAMIIETSGSDQPRTRGQKLLKGIAGFKAEQLNSSSPLFGKLAGRYGTSGFSMGGGGTTHAASSDATLRSSIALMAWSPISSVTVPTLFTCGSSDGTASCSSHGRPAYNGMPNTTPKMIVTVSSGHSGQPSAGSRKQGAWGLAFQKLYLDGDERWRSVLLAGDPDATNIQ